MKKILSILLITTMFVLSGCGGSSSNAKTKICTQTADAGEMTIKMTYSGDKISELTQTSKIQFQKLGYDEATFKDYYAQYEELYKNISGTKYKMEVVGDTAKETIMFNLNNADLKELNESGALPIDGEGADFISLKATIENYEAMGFTCK